MPTVKLKVDTYAIITRAVEEGIEYGWRRAHKQSDDPSEETIKLEPDNAIMSTICDVIKFD